MKFFKASLLIDWVKLTSFSAKRDSACADR